MNPCKVFLVKNGVVQGRIKHLEPHKNYRPVRLSWDRAVKKTGFILYLEEEALLEAQVSAGKVSVVPEVHDKVD